jgi:hypothetical protein
LQHVLGVSDGRSWTLEGTRIQPGNVGIFQLGVCPGQQRRDFGDGAFSLSARVGTAIDREFGGVLRALAAVERVAERLAVIAVGDGLFGFLERRPGAAVNSAAANLSAPAARAASIAPCA